MGVGRGGVKETYSWTETLIGVGVVFCFCFSSFQFVSLCLHLWGSTDEQCQMLSASGLCHSDLTVLVLDFSDCVLQWKCTLHCHCSSFKNPGPEHLHIQVEDTNDGDLFSHFDKACTFIGQCSPQQSDEKLAQHIVKEFTVSVHTCVLSMVDALPIVLLAHSFSS